MDDKIRRKAAQGVFRTLFGDPKQPSEHTMHGSRFFMDRFVIQEILRRIAGLTVFV
jgi:hypothetical protein